MVLHGLNGLSITDLFANNAFCDYIYDKIPAVKFPSLIRKPKGWIKLAENMNTLRYKGNCFLEIALILLDIALNFLDIALI